MRHANQFALFILTVATALTAVANEPWPQWRGPTRDGQSTSGEWPDSLSEDSLEQLWRVELDKSYSGPVLSENLVFTTETRAEKDEVVTAYDRQTGEQVWQVEWAGAMKVPFFAASNGSWIRATPVVDRDRLYVAGMRDVLVCLEAQSGDELWRVDFVQKLGADLPTFGFASSPMVDGDAIYVQAGESVMKLDKLSGDILWRTLEGSDGEGDSAFSSPVIATIAGQRQLVVQTRTELCGVDLDSGEVYWRQTVPAYRGMNIQTPVVVGDTVFTSSYQNRSWLYKIENRDGQWSVSTLWENEAKGYMSSPVVFDGAIYMQLQTGRFACLDLATGERLWTSQPYGKYASLVARGNRILALTQDGRLILFAASRDGFEKLGEAKISDQETWAHVAVSGDELYIRELNALSAYRWK